MTEQERQAVATRASAILVESGAYFPSLHADAIPLVDALIAPLYDANQAMHAVIAVAREHVRGHGQNLAPSFHAGTIAALKQRLDAYDATQVDTAIRDLDTATRKEAP